MKAEVLVAGVVMCTAAPVAVGQAQFQEENKISASAPTSGDWMGYTVAVSGDTLAVGRPGDNTPETNQGSVHVYLRSGTSWGQQAKLKVAPSGSFEQFGSGVAIDGDTLVAVGSGFAFSGSDAARVFFRTGTSWAEQAVLGGFGDDLGTSVAISGDTLVVGAPFNDLSGTDAGAALVFVRAGTTWSQQATLTPSNANPQGFGNAVAIDGIRILVGVEAKNRAYVFVRVGTTWSEETQWTRTGEFGASVALAGNRALVGSPQDTTVSKGKGSALVFVRSGTAWTEEVKLEVQGGALGASVALDGPAALVGAPKKSASRGKAYGFARTSAGWFHQATFSASDAGNGDELGFSVALSSGAAVAGAPMESSAGSAHVFHFAPLVPANYCTAGTSASGCSAAMGSSGMASATFPSGFVLTATGVEGNKNGLFYYGPNGRQAAPWGNGTSLQCITPPVKRGGLLSGVGTNGACNGSFGLDLNARWCPTCPKPTHNPGVGATVQAQLWYRDPANTGNQATSLSDALEFVVTP